MKTSLFFKRFLFIAWNFVYVYFFFSLRFLTVTILNLNVVQHHYFCYTTKDFTWILWHVWRPKNTWEDTI